MTILVTGAAGYVGNNVVRRLVKQGKPVRAMVHNKAKAEVRLGEFADKIEIAEGDVTDRNGLRPLMREVSAVVHTVAIALERGGQTYEEINYQGTINVVDAAETEGVNRFIYISQNGADSESPHRFLRSKGKAQDYVATSKLAWTTLRPSAIFGPQDEFFNSLARMVKITPLVFPLIGGGGAKFQPVSVYDVVEAVVRALEDKATAGKAFDLGGPDVLTLGDIERRILKTLNAHRALVPAPSWLLRPAVFLMEKTLPGTPVNRNLLDLLAVPNVVEDNALVNQFGIDPIPFSGSHIDYLRDNTLRGTFRKFFRGATIN